MLITHDLTEPPPSHMAGRCGVGARRACDGHPAVLHVLGIIAPRHRAITPRLYTLLSVPYGARLMRTETLVGSRSEPA